jgi:hypothetical protein
MLGAVYSNRLLHGLSAHATAAQARLFSGGSVTANPEQIDHLPAALRVLFVNASSHALQTVFLVAVPFAALAFVLSLLMKEIPLSTTAPQGAGEGAGQAEAEASEGPEPVASFVEF